MTSVTSRTGLAWDAIRISAYWDAARRQAELGQLLKAADGRLLWLLSDDRPRTLRELAEDLAREQSTVNRQVNAALEAGLLERTRSPEGTYLISASELGKKQIKTELERQVSLHDAALKAIPRDQRGEFVKHLDAYVQAFTEAVEPEE